MNIIFLRPLSVCIFIFLLTQYPIITVDSMKVLANQSQSHPILELVIRPDLPFKNIINKRTYLYMQYIN